MIFFFFFVIRYLWADELHWSVETAPREPTVAIEFYCQDQLIFQIIQKDNHDNPSSFSISDLDAKEGRVEGRISSFWLNMDCQIQIWNDNQQHKLWTIQKKAPVQTTMVSLSPQTWGAMAIQMTNGKINGLSFSQVFDGAGFVPWNGGSDWKLYALGGTTTSYPEPLTKDIVTASEQKRELRQRSIESDFSWQIRLFLLPMSFLLLGFGVWRFWQSLKNDKKNLVALILFAIVWLLILSEISGNWSKTVFMREVSFSDPITSATLLASVADSLSSFSEISTLFNFPEGHSWFILGPNWLSYWLMSPIYLMSNAIFAQNIGVLLAMVLNCYSIWLLARSYQLWLVWAFLAAIVGGAAPVLLLEIDALSLDRAFLFPVPLLFLCLRNLGKGKIWMFGAVASIVAQFYFQVYYGLYLLVALPILFLPRLLANYQRKMVIIFGTIIFFSLLGIYPGAWLLKQGTSGTVYEGEETVQEGVANIWQPVDPKKAEEYLNNFDSRSNRGSMHKDMSTPENRILAAVTNSLPIEQIVFPTQLFMGAGTFWFFSPLIILFSTKRKRLLWLYWDIGIFLILALGPLLKREASLPLNLLPYYIPQLIVPSFDQLKHPDRFVLLAAGMTGIPFAILFQSLVERYKRWISIPIVMILSMLLLFLRPVSSQAQHSWVAINLVEVTPYWRKVTMFFDIDVDTVSLSNFYHPQIWPPVTYELPETSREQGSLILPVYPEMPVEQILQILEYDIPVLNDPPHGLDPQKQLVHWAEENALLNQLLFESGYSRLSNRFVLSNVEEAKNDLKNHKLRRVIVYKELFRENRKREGTRRYLDKIFGDNIFESQQIAIWSVE